MLTSLTDPLAGAADATQFVFFKTINDFIRTEIDIFQWNLLQSTTQWVGAIALLLLTLWILIQGFRIVTGQSREPMMALVGDSLRAVLIIGLATSMAVGSSQLYFTLSDGMSTTITKMVTGSDQSAFQSIDNNLAVMQGSMALVDSLDTGGNDAAQADKDRDKWFTGIGVAGPGLIAGCMLLLNKIALALFIGFGPLFILTLLFPQTKPFFSKWLFYGMGTLFSLGVLSVMVSIAMKMVAAVSAAFAANYLASMATGTTTDGINSMSMQQGGLGLILTTLIISAPPMAAAFFQGTLGQIATYSPFGHIGEGGGRQQQASGMPPSSVPGSLPPPTDPSRLGGTTGNQQTNTFANRTPSFAGATNEQIPQRQPPSSPSGGQ
ncbi:type IV secretion system protein [Rhodanobacter sp. K2T2]|uniref:type IV secretion system protein n=1 Tax=Rhodanobacter sp. K2T2 TaxID=2723085 RepID=UPI0015CE9674|nr:type IV secretion system protein [Rhodanobacter sp. K2T2]